MRAVDNQLESVKESSGSKSPLYELNITTARVPDLPRLLRYPSPSARIDSMRPVSTNCSIRASISSGQLEAIAPEELDAVVLEWIVRRADHDTGVGTHRTR